jgi:hypothetical protein
VPHLSYNHIFPKNIWLRGRCLLLVYGSRHAVHYAVTAQTSGQTNLFSRLMCVFFYWWRWRGRRWVFIHCTADFTIFSVIHVTFDTRLIYTNWYDLEEWLSTDLTLGAVTSSPALALFLGSVQAHFQTVRRQDFCFLCIYSSTSSHIRQLSLTLHALLTRRQ